MFYLSIEWALYGTKNASNSACLIRQALIIQSHQLYLKYHERADNGNIDRLSMAHGTQMKLISTLLS